MRSKPTERRSIAAHLVLLFTVAATLLLGSGLGVLYWIVVRHATEEDAAVLNDKVAGLREDLVASDGVAVVREELQRVRTGERVYLVRVLDSGGKVVAESTGMEQLAPLESFAGLNGHSRELHKSGRLFSLAVSNVETPSGRYILQVAQDRTGDARFYRQLAALLAGVLVAGALASIIIAIRVTRRGLNPLAEMTSAVQQIGAERLDQRLAGTSWPAELQALAGAFNQMLARLHDSFGRLRQFSADLAHELRTPVANVRGEAEVALTRARTAEEYRQVIESTAVECERLSSIIDSLLFLARAEAADRKVDGKNFDAHAAAEKIAAYYSSAAEERQITITCRGKGRIFGEATLFGRALTNLLDNALRFTPEGGRIDIDITESGPETEVAVRDNGSGVPADHVSRLFDRFYRVDRSRAAGGTGLGLALVRSITELHGGSASINSTEGEGTVVRLTFPSSEMKNRLRQ